MTEIAEEFTSDVRDISHGLLAISPTDSNVCILPWLGCLMRRVCEHSMNRCWAKANPSAKLLF